MSPGEMRAVAKAFQDVSDAVRGIDDVMKKVKLERAIRRAAGELGDQAVAAMGQIAGAAEFMLDEWAEAAGHVKIASTLGAAAVRLRWRADVEERPDDLVDLLADRMARGMVILPKDLLKDLYLVGLAVKAVKGGEKAGPELERRSLELLAGAADWADRVDRARDAEKDVLVCVEPF
jgi:hypothetical protein